MLLQQEVIEIIRPVDSGQTEPYQCRLEDGDLYAVKGRNATSFGLVAEVIAGQIGRELQLPIPEFCTCQISTDLLNNSSDQNVLQSLGSGICFASSWIEPTDVFNLSMIKKIGDVQLAEVYIFDHWVENGDRTLTPRGGNVNLLLSLTDESLVAYDHNLAFSDTHKAEDMALHVGRASWNRAKDIVGFKAEMKARMEAIIPTLDAMFDDVPDTWIEESPHVQARISQALERVATDRFWNELG